MRAIISKVLTGSPIARAHMCLLGNLPDVEPRPADVIKNRRGRETERVKGNDNG